MFWMTPGESFQPGSSPVAVTPAKAPLVRAGPGAALAAASQNQAAGRRMLVRFIVGFLEWFSYERAGRFLHWLSHRRQPHVPSAPGAGGIESGAAPSDKICRG